ncbi:6744_t:CDS:1 [Cetraspora pellucida]|uniref:6744_t:CDS:1 n=1 Tax=Cetraspora pellucida TaxID=1433469 RepID=A0A9N8ZN80_9GLOM|nr:6744_t:CDS:1 [Cetraspora pellucida]
MPPTSNSLLTYRYNTTRACDFCRSSKSRCKKVHIDQPKCIKCAERNRACTYLFQPQKRGPRHSEKPPKNINPSTSLPTPSPTPPSPPTPPLPHRSPFTPLSNVFVNYEELYELIQDLSQEGINPNVNVRDSIQEENNILDIMFAEEQSSFIFNTLTSTSESPCPYKNAADHYCHEGCILRY